MDQPLDSTGSDTSPEANRSAWRKRLPQIGLSTLLLATACIAAWVSTWRSQRQIERLDARVTAMKSLTRELVVKDRTQIAIVRQQPEFDDQELWHVYLPSDSLGLHLKTRKVPAMNGAVSSQAGDAVAPLTAGHHKIELKSEARESDDGEEEWVIQVFVDDQPVLAVREPSQWKPRGGNTTSSRYDKQADLPADQPVVLFHRLFRNRSSKYSSKPPPPSENGIVLWIQ